MNPEIGHVLMGYEDLAYAYSWPLSEGRLAHVHCNSQPLGNYDQDLNVGAFEPCPENLDERSLFRLDNQQPSAGSRAVLARAILGRAVVVHFSECPCLPFPVHEVGFRNGWGRPLGFEVPAPPWPPKR